MTKGWRRPFEDPVRIDDRSLLTLTRRRRVHCPLPKKEHAAPEWQAAMQALILVAEGGGPTMFARIGIMRALKRQHVPEFNPKGKEPHWDRRKLKRDQ
ncbi:hypothetical protein ABIB75_007924 [Bradyrhizobium sp. GM2.2]|uniref:hypothetical protein n=1 Tax=unclassified Bradyrhizobium TaxID=2631580 RepID=UPI001FF72E00|nr:MULTISPECIES: hypothetical protein [unclassified Bradyrhizobium]MCK1306612.1 hypothetical protein [Bradyrhizobium sp. 45]UPK15869.1 hypothetical protein IVA93_37895 [Bradyrhizobium sp. 155]